jgi:hypothetical protein
VHSPTGDRDLPHLEGLVVSQIAVDGALRLRLQPGLDAPPADAVEVVVESTFVHRASDGSRSVCDPASQPPAVAAALGLVHRTLEWASVSEQGELALGFDDASGIVVWANPEFEAWQIVGPGRALVVCLPGGGAPAEWG